MFIDFVKINIYETESHKEHINQNSNWIFLIKEISENGSKYF